MRSMCLHMHVLVDIVFGANTREEVRRTEASSADCVTCLSGLMTDWSGLPGMDVFGLPIP